MSADRFYNAIPDVASKSGKELVAYFLYYLTVETKDQNSTAGVLAECFRECSLVPPDRLANYLSEGLKSKPVQYLKVSSGYTLHRTLKEKISGELGERRVTIQTSAELRSIESMLPDGDAKTFLREAIDCFEAGANRAAIIMTWVLTMNHLHDYVFKHHLAAFNAAFKKAPYRKMDHVNAIDDFGDMNEKKFIELCRSASAITHDQRKILDGALDIRNSCAHPSSVVVKRSKAISTIEDLVTNIISKIEI